ncbi:MAG: YraN family protein [Lentisphaeria bacterium]|nr:YraN family protein [Lentisphaeria bacterium]NQZ68475.1 YraN family protein [Lentisphaeria bacterium]
MPLISFQKAKAAHLRFGERGEKYAGKLLISLGMEILTTNYSAPGGEIDIVARDGEALCFVEVKARKPSTRTRPIDAVTLSKKRRMVLASRHYLGRINFRELHWRYDIIEIVMTHRRIIDIRYWPDEFTRSDVQ